MLHLTSKKVTQYDCRAVNNIITFIKLEETCMHSHESEYKRV